MRDDVEDLAHHGDDEVGVGVHHLLDESRIVVEQRAQALDPGQVAQRAEEAAPAVGDDDERDRLGAQGQELLLPVRPDALRQVRLHALLPEPAELLARLDRELDELRHRAHRVVLQLAHQDALVVDVEDVCRRPRTEPGARRAGWGRTSGRSSAGGRRRSPVGRGRSLPAASARRSRATAPRSRTAPGRPADSPCRRRSVRVRPCVVVSAGMQCVARASPRRTGAPACAPANPRVPRQHVGAHLRVRPRTRARRANA